VIVAIICVYNWVEVIIRDVFGLLLKVKKLA